MKIPATYTVSIKHNCLTVCKFGFPQETMDEAVLNVDNVEDNLDNYILYKNNRKSGPHGGVLLNIHSSLFFTPCAVLNEVGID